MTGDCCCGVRDFDPCNVCGCCLNDECECTKADFEMGELKDELQTCHTLINSLLDRMSALEIHVSIISKACPANQDNTSSKTYK